jgi:hypothetical protein
MMQLEDIYKMLQPNGLHDAILEKLAIDYAAGEAVFDLDVWIGDLDSKKEYEREARRKGRLQFSDLFYCVIEPPCPAPNHPNQGVELESIDAWPLGWFEKKPENMPGPLPEEAFACAIYLMHSNSFIYVAATDVSFEWLGDPYYPEFLFPKTKDH